MPDSARDKSLIPLAYPFALSPAYFNPLIWLYSIAAGHGRGVTLNVAPGGDFSDACVPVCTEMSVRRDKFEGSRLNFS